MKQLVVLDYGSGNLRSAQRALERVGAAVTVTSELSAAAEADGLVVPGVGAYAACMAGLSALRGVGGADAASVVGDRLAAGRPVLGICVGMQVMFTAGIEHGVQSAGLGLLAGRVEQLRAPILPHMGWNTVTPAAGSTLFAGLAEDTRFYFVHSYAAHESPGAVSTAVHGERFVAAVEHGALSVTQFHPEKSGDAGAELLGNWLATL